MSTENTPAQQETKQYKSQFNLKTFARRNSTQIGIIAVFIAVWVFFIAAAPNTFMSRQIYLAFMSTVPFFGIIALPLTMAIIAGEMDLSFPSIMAIGMVAFIFAMTATGSVFLALIAGLMMGIIAGAINGAIVVGIGIPSLVATIGTQFFWRGAVLVLLGGKGSSLVEVRGSLFYKLLVGKTFDFIPNQLY